MRRPAALLAFVIAASPAAAQPPRDSDQNPDEDNWPGDVHPEMETQPDEHDRDRDNLPDRDVHDRYDAWQRRGQEPTKWVELTTELEAGEGRVELAMPPLVPLSRIRIQGTQGAAVVTGVDIVYDDRVQHAALFRRLAPGEGVDVVVDRERPVRSVIVHTDPSSPGGFTVLGG